MNDQVIEVAVSDEDLKQTVMSRIKKLNNSSAWGAKATISDKENIVTNNNCGVRDSEEGFECMYGVSFNCEDCRFGPLSLKDKRRGKDPRAKCNQ